MNTKKINNLLATINPAALHGVCSNEPYRIMDVMTVKDVEANLHEVTYMALMNLVVDVNKALMN